MRRRKTRMAADLDITPLIDVLFMLIIFFVLMSSFINGKLDVDLPAGEGKPLDKEHEIVITVEKDGRMFWAGKSIEKDDLPELARAAKTKDVLIAGDKGVSYGTVTGILSILRKEGITSAGLLMQGGDTN